MEVEEQVTQMSPSAANIGKRRTASTRHKKVNSMDSSSDSDEKSSSSADTKPLNSSNENSMDLSSFYNDRAQHDDDDSDADSNSDDDSSSERAFSEGLKKRRRSGSMSRTRKTSGALHNPIKKESNKEAATRYRLKKISEKDKLFETRFNLEKENDSKRRQIELVQTEINYLKTILVQFILTKSCLKNSGPNTVL